ncbi:porin [Stieleria sp. ICT_E10.1]|uniref:porin n=1 Tax=Stieleria sedimenti TaxID=2976331 RepID=UPI002180793E|nr:porin [Stieleria sedimenti]MCS7469897.1 porin [Stieleria sedimenti]
MKLSKIAMLAAIACASYTSSMTASGNDSIELVSHCAAACDCGEPVCGCETVVGCDPCGDACDSSCGAAGCCDAGCDGGCDSACGCGVGGGLGSLLGDCCLGEQWSLFGEHCGWSAGGWVQMGYHNRALPIFNDRPDEYNLHQAWLYAEKAIDTSCGFDIGGRIDYVYGIDAQNTQAFGTGNRGWDNDWDNGGANGYGHALPQLYFEAGYGDLSVKMGHFYTIIGWEVVTAPDNFFYSHAYTMNYSEPFTHTGVLATYNVNDNVTAYGGYTLGWDSGFDDNGDSFLGGLSVALSDDLTLTYATTFGRFGAAPLGNPEQGYMHSIVADMTLSDNLQYIFQSDYLDTETSAGATVRETFGINQYLIYTLSDCWAAGGRFEWYNNEGIFGAPGNDSDIYALTMGLNYKPHANVVVRPEIRWDWDDDQVAGLESGDDQTTFGIDTIFLF